MFLDPCKKQGSFFNVTYDYKFIRHSEGVKRLKNLTQQKILLPLTKRYLIVLFGRVLRMTNHVILRLWPKNLFIIKAESVYISVLTKNRAVPDNLLV